MHRIVVVLLLLASNAGFALARTMEASTSRDIALGYADPTVDTVVVLNDVAWTDADWEGIEVPVRLTKNFTVTGRPPGPDGILVTWDGNYVSHKVRLVNVTMTWRNLVTLNTRRLNQLAPGSDILEPCAPGDWGRVVIDNCWLQLLLCYPASLQNISLSSAVRPPSIPGTQSFRTYVPQPACEAAVGGHTSSGLAVVGALPPQERCWPHLGEYVDMGTFCADMDAAGNYIVVGYTMHTLNTKYYCKDVLTEECVRLRGTLGCYTSWGAYTNSPPPSLAVPPVLAGGAPGTLLPPADVSTRDSGGGGGGSSSGLSDTDQVLVGAIVGGVSGGLLLGGVLGFLMWRRRKAKALAQGGMELPVATKGTPQGADARDAGGGAAAGSSSRGPPQARDTAGEGSGPLALCPLFWRPRANRASAPATASSMQSKLAAAAALGTNAAAGHPGRVLCSYAPCQASGVLSEATSSTTSEQREQQQLSHTTALCAETSVNIAAGAAGLSAGEPALQQPVEGLEGAAGGIYDTVEVVTLDTPQHVKVKREVLLDPMVTLLPTTLGRGTFGRVVEGRYQGQKVAVKLLNESAFGVTSGVTKSTGALPAMQGGGAGGGPGRGVGTQEGEGPEAGGGQAGMHQVILEALCQEVEVLGRCRHPNVVRLLAACLTPPRLCLVMELMDTSLERMLYGGGPDQPLLPLSTVLDIALDVAQGLSYLHPTCVHRDLKPGNVLVNMSGGKRLLAKLSDFGLSRIHSTVVETEHPEAGTPAYMAPELFDLHNFTVSHKVDVYSYGILLWTMLSGQEPWKELTLVQMAYRVAALHQRPPLDAIPPERLPPKMIRLITSCWELEPERRPAAAEITKLLLLIKEDIGGLGSHC